jgi:hypothetical protein
LTIPLHLGPDSVNNVVSTFFEANTNLQRRKKLSVSSRGEILAETMPGDSKQAKAARCVKRELVEAARQRPTIIGRPFAAQTTCRQPMHNLLARRKCCKGGTGGGNMSSIFSNQTNGRQLIH